MKGGWARGSQTAGKRKHRVPAQIWGERYLTNKNVKKMQKFFDSD